jgi:transcriptional regulator with XRE-family HTH domain
MSDFETGPDTINRLLGSYELGRKLKQLRLRKKIALTELGRHTGLSASMISQLENGKLVPTLPTLARLSMVFDVGMDYFFGSRRREGMFEIVRQEERMKFPNRPELEKPNFFFEVLAFKATNKPIEAYIAEFPQANEGEATAHLHPGVELIYVMEGTLAVQYQDEEHELYTGDCCYFDSSELHSYRGMSEAPARAFVVSAPMLLR